MDRLEKREGHLLNWYDTSTLEPLEPRYVSTVDSGNLAAYLWTLREACDDLARAPLGSRASLEAARAAVGLALDEARRRAAGPAAAPAAGPAERELAALEQRLAALEDDRRARRLPHAGAPARSALRGAAGHRAMRAPRTGRAR